MGNLKNIRTQFGLTQMEMAYYLQINRSQLALHEIDKRDLPTATLVKLAEMELFLQNLNAEASTEILQHEATQLEKAAAILAQHQKDLEFQQMLLQKKLEKLQNGYQQNCQLLQFVAHLEVKNTNKNELEKSCMQMMRSTATTNIEANGLHHQAKIKLNLQMHLLHDQANFINNLTQSMPKL